MSRSRDLHDRDDHEAFKRALLRAAATDAPSARRVASARRVFARTIAGVASGAAVTSLASAAAAKAKAAPGVVVAKGSLAAKIAATVVAAGTAGAIIGAATTERDPPPVPPPIARVAPGAPAEPAAAPLPSAPKTPEAVPPPPAPDGERSAAKPRTAATPARPPPAAPPAPASAPAEIEPTDPVTAEARRLARARRCLSASDLACAREELDAHARSPKPRLADEAAVLRIELARAERRTAEVRALAAAFLAKRPDSPYASRVRALALEERP